MKGGIFFFSQLPHFYIYSPLSHSLNLSPPSTTLSQSLSPPPSLSFSDSISLSLFLLLNEPLIRIMHGDSAKNSRKEFFLVKLAISGIRNLGQSPYAWVDLDLFLWAGWHGPVEVCIDCCAHAYIFVCVDFEASRFGPIKIWRPSR